MHPTAETPATFQETLPAPLRSAIWLPHQCITLTLPDAHGQYTFFEVWHCDQHQMYAFNVGGMRLAGREFNEKP